MIFNNSVLKAFTKDFILYDIGQKSDYLYFIKQGEVQVYIYTYIYNILYI